MRCRLSSRLAARWSRRIGRALVGDRRPGRPAFDSAARAYGHADHANARPSAWPGSGQGRGTATGTEGAGSTARSGRPATRPHALVSFAKARNNRTLITKDSFRSGCVLSLCLASALHRTPACMKGGASFLVWGLQHPSRRTRCTAANESPVRYPASRFARGGRLAGRWDEGRTGRFGSHDEAHLPCKRPMMMKARRAPSEQRGQRCIDSEVSGDAVAVLTDDQLGWVLR